MKAIKLLEKEMKEGVMAVLSGAKKKYTAKNVNPEMIDKFMIHLGWQRVGEFETNGWDYDWWLHYKNPGGDRKFTAFGGGYYGNFDFHPTDE